MSGEELGQLRVGGAPRQVAYINLGRHAKVSEKRKNIASPGNSLQPALTGCREGPGNATRSGRLGLFEQTSNVLEYLTMGAEQVGQSMGTAIPYSARFDLAQQDQSLIGADEIDAVYFSASELNIPNGNEL